METKEEGIDYLGDLQDWQMEILNSHSDEWMTDWYLSGGNYLITESQREMLEDILSWNLLDGLDMQRGIVERVLRKGYYYEKDKRILNEIRKRYLGER